MLHCFHLELFTPFTLLNNSCFLFSCKMTCSIFFFIILHVSLKIMKNCDPSHTQCSAIMEKRLQLQQKKKNQVTYSMLYCFYLGLFTPFTLLNHLCCLSDLINAIFKKYELECTSIHTATESCLTCRIQASAKWSLKPVVC